MHYYRKTRACIDNPAHHALHEFGWTIRDLYAPGQMWEEAWPDPDPCHWSQGRDSHCPCRVQCRIGLAMHYYRKTRACIDNPAHHALHEFGWTIRDLHAPRPNVMYAPSWTRVALCMAQHQIPIYDNWTALTTLDWTWYCEISVPAQSPACTQANETPLEEHRLNLAMHYYRKSRACIDNPAHHALHEFGWSIRDLYAPRPNVRGGMTRPWPLPLVSR